MRMFGIILSTIMLAAATAASSGVRSAVAPPPAAMIAQTEETIHPLTIDNIVRTDMGYIIRDWDTGNVYVFDEKTRLAPESEVDIPGYNPALTPLQWFEAYLNAPMESGLAFGMGDLFDALVTDGHIDVLRGVYWWD